MDTPLLIAKHDWFSTKLLSVFAMDRSSYPDWIVPADDPIKKIGWEDVAASLTWATMSATLTWQNATGVIS